MAIYHHKVRILSRAKGNNTIAAAAYRAGEIIRDENTKILHDYSRKKDVHGTEILTPEQAPEWTQSLSKLWNAVEVREEKSTRPAKAQLAREVILALPIELTPEQNRILIRNYVQEQYVSQGMIACIFFHAFDTHNPHVHIMLTMREITPEGFGKKNRQWNHKKLLKQQREAWARHVNQILQEVGNTERVDHRSLSNRGLDLIPQIHMGPQVLEMEKRGVRTDKGDEYWEIAKANLKIKELAAEEQRIMETLLASRRTFQSNTEGKGNQIAGKIYDSEGLEHKPMKSKKSHDTQQRDLVSIFDLLSYRNRD